MKNDKRDEYNLYAEPIIYKKYIPIKPYLVPPLVFIVTTIIVLISQLINPWDIPDIDRWTIIIRMIVYSVVNGFIIFCISLFLTPIAGKIKQKIESRRNKVLLGFLRKRISVFQAILLALTIFSMFFMFIFIIVEIEYIIVADYLSEWVLFLMSIGLVMISLITVVFPIQGSLFDVKETSRKIETISTEIMKILSKSEEIPEDENLILDLWLELDRYIDSIDDFLSSRAGIQLDQKDEITACISMLLAAGDKDNVQQIKENLLGIFSDIQKRNIPEIIQRIKLLHEKTILQTDTYEGIFLFKPRKTEIKETKERRNKWFQVLGIIVPIIVVFISPLAEKIVELFPL